MLVQKLRLQHGWSQQQLAELSGLSTRTVQRIEQGQAASTESLKALASVFEIDFSQLMPKEDAMHTATPNESIQTLPATSITERNYSVSTEEEAAFAYVRKVKRFYASCAIYVVVMLLLCAVNYFTQPNRIWVIWPALGWGLSLVIRAIRLFADVPYFGADWEKRQVEKRLGRPL